MFRPPKITYKIVGIWAVQVFMNRITKHSLKTVDLAAFLLAIYL